MKISAIVPAFNDQKSLSNCLSTLLNQTVPLHEIIVVDDGSDTPLTVPSGVRLIRIERDSVYRGSSEAKNSGAAKATGDWLAFSDDDIFHMPDAVESVIRCIEANKRDDILFNAFSLHTPAGLLEMCDWKPGDSESMECLLECFRNQNKLYKPGSRGDGVIPSRNVGPIAGLVLDVNETLMVSSEQHFGVINRIFFNQIGGYDSAAFKKWGLNNQDLCLRVMKHGGWIVSDILRSTGEVLHCFHSRPSPHNSTEAKGEFFAKYHERYSPLMLLEAGRTCIRRSA